SGWRQNAPADPKQVYLIGTRFVKNARGLSRTTDSILELFRLADHGTERSPLAHLQNSPIRSLDATRIDALGEKEDVRLSLQTRNSEDKHNCYIGYPRSSGQVIFAF